MSRLNRKKALITGGRSGIGRGIVDRYVREGATVLTCGRGERPSDLPPEVFWAKADIATALGIETLVKIADDLFKGQLDILVNNAGLQLEKTVVETSDADFDALMGVNVAGLFKTCRAFIPRMQHGGVILNIGSISANAADPGLALYNASKGFVHSLTRSIAVDHGPQIRCNAIAPGWIMTGMVDAAFALAQDPQAAEDDALARHAVKRFGRPEDIASLAVWLASEDASFATGQIYPLDGGLTAASPINPALF